MIFDTTSMLWRGLLALCGPQRVFVDGVEIHNVVYYDDESGIVKTFAIFEGTGKLPLTVQQVADSPALAALAIHNRWELPDGEPDKTFVRIPIRGNVTYQRKHLENQVDLRTLYTFVKECERTFATAEADRLRLIETQRRTKGERERAVDAGDKLKAIPAHIRDTLTAVQMNMLGRVHAAMRLKGDEIDRVSDFIRAISDAAEGAPAEAIIEDAKSWLAWQRADKAEAEALKPPNAKRPGADGFRTI